MITNAMGAQLHGSSFRKTSLNFTYLLRFEHKKTRNISYLPFSSCGDLLRCFSLSSECECRDLQYKYFEKEFVDHFNFNLLHLTSESSLPPYNIDNHFNAILYFWDQFYRAWSCTFVLSICLLAFEENRISLFYPKMTPPKKKQLLRIPN